MDKTFLQHHFPQRPPFNRISCLISSSTFLFACIHALTADPKTKSFLEKVLDPVFGFPTFVRFCWSTTQIILDKDAVACKWEQVAKDEAEEENKVKSHPMTKYFKRAADHSPDGQSNAKKRRCGEMPLAAFFADRDLRRITCLQELI
jgi:hypothetical protein